MITRAKINEYVWAGGDIDGYARSGRDSDITDEDWSLIGELVTAMTIIRRGLAAESFKRQHEARIRQVFDSEQTYQILADYEAKGEPTAEGNASPPRASA